MGNSPRQLTWFLQQNELHEWWGQEGGMVWIKEE